MVGPVRVLRTLVIWAIVLSGALAGCRQQRIAEMPLPPLDPTRMSHAVHAAIACDSCHRAGTRPGADDHAPCDDAKCHAPAFLGAPTLFCQVCHTAITTAPLVAPLKAYPTDDLWQVMPPRFSHRQHLDAKGVESRVGFHVSCVDCHTRDAALSRPSHATCARCHAAEVKLAGAPTMSECARCHDRGEHPRTSMRIIRGDLRAFSHDRHRTDRKNRAIRCEECHPQTATAKGYLDLAAPRVESCVTCHDDVDRVPPDQRMRVCETCHSQVTATLTALAPRSHLPATERPLDHTIAFRRDHAEVAATSASRCATCHVQMSGNAQQACDECHQTMLPSDHRITWRELDHGPEAGADRERCATCHVVDFCTACHSQRPRSHGMSGTFTTEHGQLARLNIRPCLTCHVADYAGPMGLPAIVSCADCHDASALGIRR